MSSVPYPVSPVQSSIDRLSLWLAQEGYHPEAAARILTYTTDEGTPTGAPDLDPGDEEWAEWAYCLGLEAAAKPDGSGASVLDWASSHGGVSCHSVYMPTGSDLALSALDWSLERLQRALADTDEMPAPISGGAPDPKSPEAIRAWHQSQEATGGFQGWLEREGGEK